MNKEQAERIARAVRDIGSRASMGPLGMLGGGGGEDLIPALLDAFPDAKGATESAPKPVGVPEDASAGNGAAVGASEVDDVPEWAHGAVSDILRKSRDRKVDFANYRPLARLLVETRRRAIEECARRLEASAESCEGHRCARQDILALRDREPAS